MSLLKYLRYGFPIFKTKTVNPPKQKQYQITVTFTATGEVYYSDMIYNANPNISNYSIFATYLNTNGFSDDTPADPTGKYAMHDATSGTVKLYLASSVTGLIEGYKTGDTANTDYMEPDILIKTIEI